MNEVNEARRKIQNEAVTSLKENNFNGIVMLPTGTGKSWVMIQCLQLIQQKYSEPIQVLYLCNSTDLRDKGFKDELEKWNAEFFYDNMSLMCYQSARKLKGESIQVLLCDEFDFSLTPKYSEIYFNNEFQYKILVSATIDDSKLDLAKSIAPIVYSVTLKDVEESKVLNKSNYYIVNFNLSDDENKEYLEIQLEFQILISDREEKIRKEESTYFIDHKLELLTFRRKHFLNALNSSKEICRALMSNINTKNPSGKALIFCELTKQADAVCKYSYHSETQKEGNLEKFILGEIPFLSVCGKVNRGVNIPGVNSIIFESCNQSSTQLVQRLGRGKRLKINEVLDVYFLVPHYKTRNGWRRPTKVQEWILKAAKKLDIGKELKVYKF